MFHILPNSTVKSFDTFMSQLPAGTFSRYLLSKVILTSFPDSLAIGIAYRLLIIFKCFKINYNTCWNWIL